MSAIPYDALKYLDQLEAAGLPREQARVIVETQQAALAEAVASQLSTRGDFIRLENTLSSEITRMENTLTSEIARLDAKVDLGFSRIEGEMKLTRWMLGILLGGVASLILKAFF